MAPAAAPIEVDVAVIGGGVTGVSAAYHVAAGGATVALLDRGRLGDGASGKTPGLVLTGIGDHLSRLAHGVGRDEAVALWRFSEANGRIIRDLVEKHAIACGYERRGTLA